MPPTRKALIRLAATLPVGSSERRVILEGEYLFEGEWAGTTLPISFVRYTPIGIFLNGRRKRPAQASVAVD